MRKHVMLQVLILAVVCAVAASAADITGKYVAQVPGRDGNTQEQTFNFKQAGETLTGTVSTQRGDQQITDGKVVGDAVSFVTVMSMGGGDMKSIYKGTVAGNEIKFTRTREGGGRGPGTPVEFVAKKAS